VGGLRGLCGLSCRFCEANAEFIMSHRPDLIDDLNALIGDAYGLVPTDHDANSLFEFALERVVEPLSNYVLHSVLECSLYPGLFSMRLIIESLAVGLYADWRFRSDVLRSKLDLTSGFDMGMFRRCRKIGRKGVGGENDGNDHFLLCSQYNALGREVNEALNWLRDLLGGDAVGFIYEVYNDLSKPIHAVTMIDGRLGGRYVRLSHGAISLSMVGEFPPMRTTIMPAECEEDDLVILDLIHWDSLLTRLSMDMLIYAWQSIVRRANNEELTKIGASIEEAIRRAEEVYNEIGSRYGLQDNK